MPRSTLILLPGMMCDERVFAPQMEALSATHEIIVPELMQNSIHAMAENVLENAPKGPLNIAGLSMGGIVAMQMVAISPKRVARLALLDTNPCADQPGRRELRKRQIADVRNGRLHDVIADEMKPAYLARINRDDKALLNLLIDMAMDCGEEAFIAQSQALRDRPDMRATIAQYDGPALVLCGAEDRLCPPERHREMSKMIANASLAIIGNAGHISTLENPDAVNNALKDWLSRPA